LASVSFSVFYSVMVGFTPTCSGPCRAHFSHSTHLNEERRSTLLKDIGRISSLREAPDKTLAWAAQLPPEDSASVTGSVVPVETKATLIHSIFETDLSWIAKLPQQQRQDGQAAVQHFATEKFLTIPEAVSSALKGE
jgi:hypothetical protein